MNLGTDRPDAVTFRAFGPPRPKGIESTVRRVTGALVAAFALALASCSTAAPPTAETTPKEATAATAPSTALPPATMPSAWARIDRELAALGPGVGLLAARVLPDGRCEPIHEVDPTTPRPMGSQFKLYVLGAVVDAVAAGSISWDQTVTITDATKSLGNGEGSLQSLEPGTAVSVRDAATKMISISDNTATDLLIARVGRPSVEAKMRQWHADADANVPFLTTRQMLLLHYVPGLGERYRATEPEERATFLATVVDPRPLTDIGAGLSADPRFVDSIEWFASPHDVCRAFSGLQQQATNPSGAPLPTVLSREVGGIGLDGSRWPTVWFKGGSEPGVLTLGWLATTSDGQTFVVEAMVTNPDAPLAEDSITRLRDLAGETFQLLGQDR